MSTYQREETPDDAGGASPRNGRYAGTTKHTASLEPEPLYGKVLGTVLLIVIVGLVCLVFPHVIPAVVAIGILAAIGRSMEKDQRKARQESEDRIVQRIAEELRRRP
jgi:hypothetical protein